MRVTAGYRNVSEIERWASLAAGTALTVYGMNRRRGGGWMMAGLGAVLLQRGATGHCHVYRAFGLDTSSADTRQALGGRAGVAVDERVIVARPAAELYQFWRNLENLPRFMKHLESVERLTDTLSRWRAKGPVGTTVEWNAEMINDVPGKLIGWKSIEGSDVVSAGSVHFDPAGTNRTRVRVRLQYNPPGGKAGAAIAWLMGSDAGTEIREDLQRFRELIETERTTER
jgi:uncharacterized membrane protein